MSDYHRLDVGINLIKKRKRGIWTWSLNIYNVYNRKNPLYYYIDYPEYKTQSQVVNSTDESYSEKSFPDNANSCL